MAKLKTILDSGNKGEWAEIYAFFKLLADGEIYSADDKLRKIPTSKFSVIKILRTDQSKNLEYEYDSTIKLIKVIDGSSGKMLLNIPITVFQNQAEFLFNAMKTGKKTVIVKKGVFKIPRIYNYLNAIYINQIKQDNGNKQDITIVIHDMYTGLNPTLGFSIKSYIGEAPTLVNASQLTNFTFLIKGHLTSSDIAKINSMVIKTKSKEKTAVKERILELKRLGCSLEFDSMDGDIYHSNVTMIDSKMPYILAELLKLYYLNEGSTVSELIKKLTELNPLKYNTSIGHPYYEYKIKNFLYDSALGMIPKKLWNGFYDASGGYIAVKNDGDIVAYHVYNKNTFLNYLFNQTKLDTAMASRHKFGEIYHDKGNYYIKLNLDVRFLQVK